MTHKNFDETLNRLNQYYDEMPTQSSSSNIMANIKRKKKRDWSRYYQRWQVAALIVLMVGIGYVLGASQLTGQQDSASDSEIAADQSEPQMELGIAAVEEVEEEAYSEEAVTREIPNALMTDDETSMPLEIINEEGLADVIQVYTFEDEEFGLTTKYDVQLEVHYDVDDDGRAIQWFANYSEGPVEPVVLEIFRFENAGDQRELIEAYRTRMLNLGYQEDFTEEYMKGQEVPGQGIEELLFERDGVYAHVVPVEHGENLFFFKTSLFAPNSEYIEYSEGFGRNVKVIYEQFSWMYN
ncbi:hypothetical protein [Halalkalibacter akibai]|uniref:Uncharacterized protein n=1 Tax=Halalkalibacter akibai (strain ATCC 43226 / DSM 21942 / CIP 109018 / JCM 9157 / 1139) TaxID=1236973 RepID=W4QQF1_HALA3|nr:hypothetical protein [Halalkalibacter akibai]GAE34335.1 hypothetical protein JCM9157_1385 [Halalkalibacter akibai JCM 9157]